MDGIKRRDLLKGSATLALAAGTAAFPRIGIIEAAAEASANLPFKQWQAAKHRELDVRDFGRSRLTDGARQALHARAQALSDRLPGAHRIRIAAFDAFTGNPSCVVSDDAGACAGDWLDTEGFTTSAAAACKRACTDSLSLRAARLRAASRRPHGRTASFNGMLAHIRDHAPLGAAVSGALTQIIRSSLSGEPPKAAKVDPSIFSKPGQSA